MRSAQMVLGGPTADDHNFRWSRFSFLFKLTQIINKPTGNPKSDLTQHKKTRLL